jgi:very-short-patch-repair endonuclease
MKRDFARKLRRETTEAERRLWFELRDRRFFRFKFRRQQPIGPYVADFICFEAMLIVELDGSQHGLPENAASDRARTAYLTSRGYRVLRFWNGDVDENIDGVLGHLWRELGEPKPPEASRDVEDRSKKSPPPLRFIRRQKRAWIK